MKLALQDGQKSGVCDSKPNKSIQRLPAVVVTHGFLSTAALGCTLPDEGDWSALTCEHDTFYTTVVLI